MTEKERALFAEAILLLKERRYKINHATAIGLRLEWLEDQEEQERPEEKPA